MGVGVRVRLQPRLQRRVVHQGVEGLGDLLRRTEVDQDASVVGERFLGMQIRRGDDGLAGAERVAQRAAGDLVRVEVRRDVDVARQQELDDVVLPQVLVHEGDVVADAQLLDDLDQLVAVLLAVAPQQFRMGLARDEVQRVGMLRGDGGHRLQDVLQPFARAHQAERRHDMAPVQAQLVLQASTALGFDVRHAVLDDRYGGAHAVDLVQDADGRFGHDDQAVGGLGDLPNGGAHGGRGLRKHGVHRDERGLADLLEERGEVILVGPLDPAFSLPALVVPEPVQPELVLDADDVDIRGRDRASGAGIALGGALGDAPANLAAVGPNHVPFVDRGDVRTHGPIGLVDRVHQVGGEGGHAATPGGIGRNEGDAHPVTVSDASRSPGPGRGAGHRGGAEGRCHP